MPRKATATVSAARRSLSVFHAEAYINRTAKIVENYIQYNINKIFRIIQLNIQKQSAVHNSLINNKKIQDTAAIAIQESQARRISG